MKHVFSRVAALILALAMTFSLCVSPAWAADPSDPDPSLDNQLIILKDTTGSYLLTVENVKEGDVIQWTSVGNATVSANTTTVKVEQTTGELTGNTITVGASRLTSTNEKADPGRVEVTVKRDGNQHGDKLKCLVYCGVAPFTAPQSLEPLNVDQTRPLEITIDYFGELFQADDFTFTSSSGSATVTRTPTITDYHDGKKKLTVSLTGVKEGTPKITMTTKWGYTQSWDLTVKKSTDTLITFMTVAPDNLSMTVGDTYDRLKIGQVLPSNATNKEVEWSSANPNIATVDENGKVTATGAGTTTITATAKDGNGATAACRVTVKEADSM